MVYEVVGKYVVNKCGWPIGQPIGSYRKPIGFYRQLEHFL
jgi:hypothetical protein